MLAIASFILPILFASTTAVSVSQSPTNTVSVIGSPEKESYLSGEPITFTATWKNLSNREVTFRTSGDYDCGEWLQYQVMSTATGTQTPLFKLPIGVQESYSPLVLKGNGGKRTDHVVLHRLIAPRKPGTYVVTCFTTLNFQDAARTKETLSSTFTVRIIASKRRQLIEQTKETKKRFLAGELSQNETINLLLAYPEDISAPILESLILDTDKNFTDDYLTRKLSYTPTVSSVQLLNFIATNCPQQKTTSLQALVRLYARGDASLRTEIARLSPPEVVEAGSRAVAELSVPRVEHLP